MRGQTQTARESEGPPRLVRLQRLACRLSPESVKAGIRRPPIRLEAQLRRHTDRLKRASLAKPPRQAPFGGWRRPFACFELLDVVLGPLASLCLLGHGASLHFGSKNVTLITNTVDATQTMLMIGGWTTLAYGVLRKHPILPYDRFERIG